MRVSRRRGFGVRPSSQTEWLRQEFAVTHKTDVVTAGIRSRKTFQPIPEEEHLPGAGIALAGSLCGRFVAQFQGRRH